MLTDGENSMLIEEIVIEKTPPGREDQVKALKKKWPNDLERVYATAWASYNKRKK